MKYVMFKKVTGTLTIYHPVIFPNHLVHADIAQALTGYQVSPPLAGFTVDSAGEWNGFECSGSSSTLGIDSKPERDTRIIAMNDYGGGLTED